MEYIFVSIFFGFITGTIGRYIAVEKNRSPLEGFWFGFLLSLFGVLIVSLMPTKESDYNLKSIEVQTDEMPVTEFSSTGKLFFYTVLLIIVFSMIYGYLNS
jgi:LytS/YehU family sensor histidine kinase